jgi:WD40 repeat protein
MSAAILMTTRTKVGRALLLVLTLSAGTNTLADPPPSEKNVEEKPASTDLYGDPLPPGAIARLGTVRFRHGAIMRDAAVSPDGRTLISAGVNVVKIWDAQTGRLQRKFLFSQPFINGITLSPDGKLLAVSQQGGNKMRFLEPTSGKELFPFGDAPPRALRAVLSPNGELLATLDPERPPTVSIWDIRKGKKIRTINSGVASIWTFHTLAFSPNGHLLAFPSETGVRVWDLAAGKELYSLDPGMKTAGGCVAFSADGKLLATASMLTPNGKDHAIHLWDMTTGKKTGELPGHERYIAALAVPSKKNLLASIGGDGRIRFWDMVKQQELGQSAGPHRFYHSIHFSVDGRVLASGEFVGGLRLWDPNTRTELAASAARSSSLLWVNFAPDGQNLISTERDQIGFWDPFTGRTRRRLEVESLESSPSILSPEGKSLVTLDHKNGGRVLLWDLASGKLVRRFGEGGRPNRIFSCAFSADGRRLAGGSFVEDIIHIWDVASGKELLQLKGQKTSGALAFSPDGTTLAAGNGPFRGDYTVHLWTLATGEEIWRKDTRPLTVNDLKFSPDGRTLAVVGGFPGRQRMEGSIRLWETATGKELKHLDGHRQPVRCVTFSSDGRMLVTGSFDNTIRLWEIETGKERRRFQGHQNTITVVSFSPDGRLLASASLDTTALVWDLTGRCRDGRFQERRLSAEELNRCWNDLAQADAAQAYRSMRALTGSPKETIKFLNEHMSPVQSIDPKRVAPLLDALGSDQCAQRDKAMTELEQLGLAVEPALRAAMNAKPSLEVRRRIEAILDKLAGAPRLRFLRALEALEHIGTAEARQVVTALSTGTAEMWPTQEAKASLSRLAQQRVSQP